MPRYPLTYFEIQKYYKNEPKFNYVYSRKILPKIKGGTINNSWWVQINTKLFDSFIRQWW